jgi:hypothetical protein
MLGLALGLLSLAMIPDDVQAQSYTRLQVLLPGETAAPGTVTGKLGTPDAQTVGIPFEITVRACDASWNTVGSVTNLVRITSSDESAQLPPDGRLAGGEMARTVTLNAAGTFTITASDQSDPTIPDGVSAGLMVSVIQGFAFSAIHQKNQYAGLPMTISVSAVDPSGQVVTGYSGQIRLKQITSFGEGRITPSAVTLTHGTWSGPVTMYRADETSINRGNVNMYAYLEAQPAKNGTSDPFTVHPGPFSRLQIVAPGQDPWPGSVTGLSGSPATQGATQHFVVDVFATDAYWNPAPSADQVRITSSDPAATTPVSGLLIEGHVQLNLALGTVGAQTLTVTDQTNGSIASMTSAPIPVIAAAVSQFLIDPMPATVTAGQAVSVTIRAADAAGNTLIDYTGDAFLSANTGAGSISPESIHFAGGIWSGTVIFRGAGGAVSFSCSDYSAPPHTGTSDNFTVLPGPYTGLQILLPGQTPRGGTPDGFNGTPNSQAAGAAFDIVVRAVDAYWNRVSGIASHLQLTSSDPFLAAPEPVQLVNGEISVPVTLYKAGLQTITAADIDSVGIDPQGSLPVEVIAGQFARLLLLAPGEEIAPGAEEGRSGAATDQSINFAFTVQVYATDPWFNPVGGVSDVVRLTSNDPLAELPPETALMDGHATPIVRLSTGGFQQLTVTDVTQPAILSSTTQVRTISSGLHLEAELDQQSVMAGEPFTLTVKVTNDAGSVIQEINTFVDVSVIHASTQDPGRGLLLNTRFQLLQGQRSISQTYTYAEPIILIITDDAGNTPAATEVILIQPGFPDAIHLSCDPSWVGGNKHATISAQVVDPFENGVPGQPVDFELAEGLGVLTPIDDQTKQDGTAWCDFLSPRTPEIDLVRAVSGHLSATLDVEVALVDPDAKGGTVTNYPNPFHPDQTPTTIAYKLDEDAQVRLRIFTLSGGLVLDREFASGAEGGMVGLNEFLWDGLNGDGEPVASGGYILNIEAERKGTTLHTMRRKIGVVR